MRKVYTHSGKVGCAPIAIPVAGVIGVLICALPYAYADVYSPLAFLNVFLLVFYGLAVGLFVAIAGRMANSRSLVVTPLLGGLVGAFAVYAAWAGFFSVLIGRHSDNPPGFFHLLVNPRELWTMIEALNQTGWFTMSNTTPTGPALWALWGVEALTLVGGGVYAGFLVLSDEVFCEGCGEWAAELKPLARFVVPDDPAVLSDLRAGATAPFEDLAPSGAVLGECLEVMVHACETCEATSTYQTRLVTRSLDNRESEEVKIEALTPRYFCDRAQVEVFKRLAARYVPGEEPADHEAAHAESAKDAEDVESTGDTDGTPPAADG